MASTPMPEPVTDHAFLLGGATALAFGIVLMVRQETVTDVGILLIGLWWLVQGLLLLHTTLWHDDDRSWRIVVGALGVSAAAVALADPIQGAEFLGSVHSVVLGANALAIAATGVFGGLRGGGTQAMLFGVVSGVLGLLLLVYPGATFATLITTVAVLLIVHGLSSALIASAG